MKQEKEDYENQEPLLDESVNKTKSEKVTLVHENYSTSEDESKKQNDEEDDDSIWNSETYNYEFSLNLFLKNLSLSLTYISPFSPLILIHLILTRSRFIINYHKEALRGLVAFFKKLNSDAMDHMSCCGFLGLMLELTVKAVTNLQFIMVFAGLINATRTYGELFTKGKFEWEWPEYDFRTWSNFQDTVIIVILVSAMNSFVNKQAATLINTETLSLKSLKKLADADLPLYKTKDLKRTILRLDIDISLYYLQFMDRKNKFERSVPDVEEFEIIEKDQAIYSKNQVSKSDLIAEAYEFEEVVFDYKYLTKKHRNYEHRVYAYTFAESLVENFPKGYGDFLKFMIFISVFVGRSVIIFLEQYKEDESFVTNVKIWGHNFGWLLENGINLILVFKVLSQAIKLLLFRARYLEMLNEMIAPGKYGDPLGFDKQYTTLNILDPKSLRAWAILRKIFMNLNEQRLKALTLAASIILIIQVSVIGVLIVLYIRAFAFQEQNIFLSWIVLLIGPSFLYAVMVLIFVWIGVKVNNQFQTDIYNLRQIKTTALSILQFSPDMISSEQALHPSTFVYTEGFKYLKSKFDSSDPEKFEKEVKDRRDELVMTYDSLIEELEAEEKHNPLKLLGVPMNRELMGYIIKSLTIAVLIPLIGKLWTLWKNGQQGITGGV